MTIFPLHSKFDPFSDPFPLFLCCFFWSHALFTLSSLILRRLLVNKLARAEKDLSASVSWSKFREFHEKKYLKETKKNCPAGAVSRLSSVEALVYLISFLACSLQFLNSHSRLLINCSFWMAGCFINISRLPCASRFQPNCVCHSTEWVEKLKLH